MIDYNTMTYSEGRAMLKEAFGLDAIRAMLGQAGETAKGLWDQAGDKAKGLWGQAGDKAKGLWDQGKAWSAAGYKTMQNPWIQTPLYGALGGAGLGLASSALQRKGQRAPVSRALRGALLGGLAGLGGKAVYDAFNQDEHGGIAARQAAAAVVRAKGDSQAGFGAGMINVPGTDKQVSVPGLGAPAASVSSGPASKRWGPSSANASPEYVRLISDTSPAHTDPETGETTGGDITGVNPGKVVTAPFVDAVNGVHGSVKRIAKAVGDKGISGAFGTQGGLNSPLADTATVAATAGGVAAPWVAKGRFDPYSYMRNRFGRGGRIVDAMKANEGVGVGPFAPERALGETIGGKLNPARTALKLELQRLQEPHAGPAPAPETTPTFDELLAPKPASTGFGGVPPRWSPRWSPRIGPAPKPAASPMRPGLSPAKAMEELLGRKQEALPAGVIKSDLEAAGKWRPGALGLGGKVSRSIAYAAIPQLVKRTLAVENGTVMQDDIDRAAANAAEVQRNITQGSGL